MRVEKNQMIEISKESVLPLTEVAALLPRRSGKKVHIATLYRWTVDGCRGVVLESIQVGSTRCSSREALQRFVNQLSEPSSRRTTAVKGSPATTNRPAGA